MADLEAYLEEAAKWVGTVEVPKGSNLTEITRIYGPIGGYPYGGYGYPWCMAFCWAMAKLTKSGNLKVIPRTASTIAARDWYRQRGRIGQRPQRGALVFYGKPSIVHVEIVEKVLKNGDFITIGGNTSGEDKNGKINPNGDGCYRKRVSRNNPRINCFAYPDWDEEGDSSPSKPGKDKDKGKHRPKPVAPPWPGEVFRATKPRMRSNDIERWKRQMIKRGYEMKPGPIFGTGAAKAARALQRKIGEAPDGRVGEATWRAAWES